jgi:hypothetical protein
MRGHKDPLGRKAPLARPDRSVLPAPPDRWVHPDLPVRPALLALPDLQAPLALPDLQAPLALPDLPVHEAKQRRRRPLFRRSASLPAPTR